MAYGKNGATCWLAGAVRTLMKRVEMLEAIAAGAPASTVYKSHSGSIGETLEDLKSKAESQLAEARQTEATASRNFQMLQQSLEDEMKFNAQDLEASKSALTETQGQWTIDSADSKMTKASSINSADATKFTALVQNPQNSDDAEDIIAAGAPASTVYKSHSGSIVETLEDLKSKDESQLAETRQTEATASRNFQMFQQSLEDEMKFNAQDLEASKSTLTETQGQLTTDSADLKMTKASPINSADATKLTALVQNSQNSDDAEDFIAAGAPTATVYKSHSGSIVKTLEDLISKAESQPAEARQAEATASRNFQMLQQWWEDEMKFDAQEYISPDPGGYVEPAPVTVVENISPAPTVFTAPVPTSRARKSVRLSPNEPEVLEFEGESMTSPKRVQRRRRRKSAPLSPDQTSSLLVGAGSAALASVEEVEVDGDADESGIDPKDIKLVMTQSSCSRSKAVSALRANNNNILEAMTKLWSETAEDETGTSLEVPENYETIWSKMAGEKKKGKKGKRRDQGKPSQTASQTPVDDACEQIIQAFEMKMMERFLARLGPSDSE